jgi:hypothetical protein
MFLLNLTGVIHMPIAAAFGQVWLLAFSLYALQVILALSQAKEEDTLSNICLAGISYFTYCQLWIPVVCKCFYDDFISHKKSVWAKTERFQVTAPALPLPLDAPTARAGEEQLKIENISQLSAVSANIPARKKKGQTRKSLS